MMSPDTSTPRPAYLISSMRVLQPEKLGPFRQAAAPLIAEVGATSLAAGNPALHVLEGTWSLGGNVLVIERYPSMEHLTALWNSEAFQAARKLTDGFVDVQFVVALEGR